MTADVRTDTYTAFVTTDAGHIRAAQDLRHRVFTAELGARLPGDTDRDSFDDICDHLVVTHGPTAEVVGCYRLLPPGRSTQLYSAGEFDTRALAPLLPQLIEGGRSCVHPAHRTGAAITTLWAAIARYTLGSGNRYLAGCASVPLGDGGQAAAAMLGLAGRHAAPERFRVRPHQPWSPVAALSSRPSYRALPPLLRGYLRLGAWVCGPPAHDPEFGVADFLVLLDLNRADPRYLRHFGVGELVNGGRS